MALAPQATLFSDVMRLKKTTPIASLLLPLRFYAAQSPSKCHPLPPTSDLAIRHRLLIPRWPKRCSTPPSIFLPKQLSFALLVATPSTRALSSRYRPPSAVPMSAPSSAPLYVCSSRGLNVRLHQFTLLPINPKMF
jgi:hypothetical protein